MIQASLLFIICSSLTTLLMSLLIGHLSGGIALTGLILGLGIAFGFYEKDPLKNPPVWQKFILAIFFIMSSFQFLFLLYERNPTDLGIYTLNPNNIGDLPFHINMIRAFARGLEIWPQNPIFSFEVLKYPFGMNLFNAQFEALGVHLRTHLVVTGLFCLLLTFLSLYRWMGLWGVCAFFLSGGFASFSELIHGQAWLSDSSIAWKNLFLAVFVTQRGMLLAIPAGAYLLSEFYQDNAFSWRKKIALAVIWGALAFFHLHSFFILSLIIGILIVAKRSWQKSWPVAVAALLIALPFLAVSLAPSPSWVNPMKISWGWMLGEDENILVFLLKNFGTWLALMIVLLWISLRRKINRVVIFSSLLLTIVFFNFMLAPWKWDQIKILCWCYLLLNAVMYESIIKHMNWKLQLTTLFIVFYPGLVQIYSAMPAFSQRQAVRLFAKKELLSLGPLLKDINPNDRVFIAPRFDHPLFYFGQSVVMGYSGHIWSHGYSPAQLEDKIKSVLSETVNLARFRELEAKYILFSSYETESFGLSTISEQAMTSSEGQDGAWILVKVPLAQPQ